jgi:hypothetical protein
MEVYLYVSQPEGNRGLVFLRIMRPDGEMEAGAVVVREERGPTLGQTQRTANPGDGIASVRVILRRLPWETNSVGGRSSVTEVGWAGD